MDDKFTKSQSDAISKVLCLTSICSISFGYFLGEIDVNHHFFEGQKVDLISERCEHGSCRSLILLPSGERIEVASDRLEFKRVSF